MKRLQQDQAPATPTSPLPSFLPLENFLQSPPAPKSSTPQHLQPILPKTPAMDYLDLSLSPSSPETPPTHQLSSLSPSPATYYVMTSEASTQATSPTRRNWRSPPKYTASAPGRLDRVAHKKMTPSPTPEQYFPARKRLKFDEEAVEQALLESSQLSSEEIKHWDNFNYLY